MYLTHWNGIWSSSCYWFVANGLNAASTLLLSRCYKVHYRTNCRNCRSDQTYWYSKFRSYIAGMQMSNVLSEWERGRESWGTSNNIANIKLCLQDLCIRSNCYWSVACLSILYQCCWTSKQMQEIHSMHGISSLRCSLNALLQRIARWKQRRKD